MPNSFTPQQIEEFLQEFFDVVGARQYIGARYVPIFGRAGEDTVEWDDGAPYEPLTVVMHQGVSYVSRRYVPTGIQVTDTDYWVETYRFNAQVEQYRQEVLSFQGQIDQVREDMESDYVPFPDSDLYPKFGTMGQVLSTLSDGTTKWEDPVVPSDAQAEAVITEWLADHPEATTTVQDGAITWAKLADSLAARLMHSSNSYIYAATQASWDYDDANEQPNNTTLLVDANVTSAMFPNLPKYGKLGLLFKINYSSNNADAYAQFYATRDANNNPLFYMRHQTTGYMSNWFCVYPAENVSDSSVFKSSDLHYQSSNQGSWTFTDANDQPRNSIMLIASNVTESMFANLPQYGKYALMAKFNFSKTDANGYVQMFFTFEGAAAANGFSNVYMRTQLQVGITAWSKIYPVENAGSVNGYNAASLFKSSSDYLYPNTIDTWPFNDANDQPRNTVCLIDNNVTSAMMANLPAYGKLGLLSKLNFSKTVSDGFVQTFVTYTTRAPHLVEVYSRVKMVQGYTDWIRIYPAQIPTNMHTCNILKKVVCCGDSYTAGYIALSAEDITNVSEENAWPHYMETITGNTYVNCGHSGATVLSWLTANRGLPKAQSAGTAQAYIIGLMINDVGQSVPVGTPSDIGDIDPTTYYGGLAKIVRELHAISPDAYIFIQTCPRTTASYDPYNQAVKDVVEAYAQTYHTHLLDLRKHIDLYLAPSITGDSIMGHYTSLGYQQFAEILSRILSEYINSHISVFQKVHEIPYT